MIRFRLFGFPVTVEPWHWAILAFCGGALRIKESEDLLPVLLFMAAGVVSIIIHEFGHALTMRVFGGRHISIVLHGMGGHAICQGAPPFSRGQHILISLAGPLLQVACGLLVVIAVKMSADTSSGATVLEASPVYQLLYSFIYVSLFWAVLNLIPVYPMDGGQILRGILGPRRIQLTLQISIIVAIFVGAGFFFVFKSILIPMFMVFSAVENYKALKRARNPGAW